MTCDQTQSLLEAFADGELGWETAWRVRRHLAGCASCAAALAEINAISSRVQGWRDVSAPADFGKRIAAALPAVPPCGIRHTFLPRRAAVGLAGAIAAIAAFFWLVPGQPGRPTIAFADVERAMQQVQTVSYDMNTQVFDAQGHVSPGATTYSESIWLRRTPAASGFVDHKTSVRYLFDRRGTTAYNLKNGTYWKQQLPPHADVVKEIDWQMRNVTEAPTEEAYPPPDPSHTQQQTFTPWQQQKVIRNGSNCLKFTRTLFRIIGNHQGTIHFNIWVDAKTLHITDIEINGDAMFMAKGYMEHAVFSNFHYNETPPADVFDWSPPPGAKVRGHW